MVGLGWVGALATGAVVAGAIVYFVLRDRVLVRGRALAVAGAAAAALVVTPFAAFAALSWESERADRKEAERLCHDKEWLRQADLRFRSFDACVDWHRGVVED